MKLILQIAIGVYLGSLAAQFTFQLYRDQQAAIAQEQVAKIKLEQDKKRHEQANIIRNILLQNRQKGGIKPPGQKDGSVPDDVQPQ